MSDGKTHNVYYTRGWIFALVLAVFFLVIGLRHGFLEGIIWCIFSLFNYFICRWIDPDLDQIGITLQEGRMLRDSRKLSCFVGFFGALWVSYWFMYAWLIGLVGGHRSIASHGFAIGGFIRMIYLNLLLLFVLVLLALNGIVNWHWQNAFYNLYLDIWLAPYLITQFFNWLLADSIHLALDYKILRPKK